MMVCEMAEPVPNEMRNLLQSLLWLRLATVPPRSGRDWIGNKSSAYAFCYG